MTRAETAFIDLPPNPVRLVAVAAHSIGAP